MQPPPPSTALLAAARSRRDTRPAAVPLLPARDQRFDLARRVYGRPVTMRGFMGYAGLGELTYDEVLAASYGNVDVANSMWADIQARGADQYSTVTDTRAPITLTADESALRSSVFSSQQDYAGRFYNQQELAQLDTRQSGGGGGVSSSDVFGFLGNLFKAGATAAPTIASTFNPSRDNRVVFMPGSRPAPSSGLPNWLLPLGAGLAALAAVVVIVRRK